MIAKGDKTAIKNDPVIKWGTACPVAKVTDSSKFLLRMNGSLLFFSLRAEFFKVKRQDLLTAIPSSLSFLRSSAVLLYNEHFLFEMYIAKQSRY